MYQIKIIDWGTEGELAKNIRRKVFIEEQKVSLEEEWDGKDARTNTLHFIALDGEKAVGTARLINHQQVGRMAVLKEYRSKKVGSAILRAVVRESLRLQRGKDAGPRVYLHAQVEALGFYQKHGFVPFGEDFMDAGIPHHPLRLEWNSANTVEAIFRDDVIRLETLADFQFHLFLLGNSACRHLDIYSETLNPELFAECSVFGAISSLARRSRNSVIRILVRDSSPLHGTSHPLVTLAQRLSSKIEVRTLNNGYTPPEGGFAIFDRRRMVYFNNEEGLQGFANYRAPAEAQHELEEFNRCWNHHSETDPNLQQFYI